MKRVGMKRVVCEWWFFLTVDIQKWNFVDSVVSKTKIKFFMLKQGCTQKHSHVMKDTLDVHFKGVRVYKLKVYKLLSLLLKMVNRTSNNVKVLR